MLFVGVFLLVVITATLVTFTLPESFASISRIMLRLNSSNAAGPTAPQDASGTFDPRFIRNQCAVIQSEGILGKVISDLDLNKEWGKRYAGGERLKTSETLALLRARMDWRLLPKTSVIEIRSYSEKPDEAAKVANALAEAYRDHINSPESAVSVSSGARVKMLAMPATTPEPVPPDSATSRSSGLRVEILDRAVPGLVPVRPNKPLNISLGVLIGLLLGFLAGAGAWWVGLQAGQKPGANPQS
jgi:uncharacterized protein involved in exopolysaccharide biosynthesis